VGRAAYRQGRTGACNRERTVDNQDQMQHNEVSIFSFYVVFLLLLYTQRKLKQPSYCYVFLFSAPFFLAYPPPPQLSTRKPTTVLDNKSIREGGSLEMSCRLPRLMRVSTLLSLAPSLKHPPPPPPPPPPLAPLFLLLSLLPQPLDQTVVFKHLKLCS
jgi:hypothetical protein